jgi:hypothetical protein
MEIVRAQWYYLQSTNIILVFSSFNNVPQAPIIILFQRLLESSVQVDQLSSEKAKLEEEHNLAKKTNAELQSVSNVHLHICTICIPESLR